MAFETTIWTEIRHARERRGAALDDLVRRYWDPVRRFIEGRGFAAADAEDLAQDVLAEVCREEFLRKADASKGRFRSLLLAVTRHVIANHVRARTALKRTGEAPLQAEPAAAPEEAEYNRCWAAHLMRRALDRLRAEHPEYAQAIGLHYFEEVPYRDIAARLGRRDHDVKNFIFQGKRRLRECLQELVREYCCSPDEFRGELEELARWLPS